MKRKRVLFVTRCFPPTQGGMERFAYDLQVTLSNTNDITVRTLKYGGPKLGLIVVLPVFFVRAWWLLLTKQVDVIHAQDGVVSIMLNPLRKLFDKPMVVVIHGLDVTYKLGLFQKLIQWSLGGASAVICISSAARDEVVKRGVDLGRTRVIPIGVTDDLFIGDPDKARKAVCSAIGDVSGKKLLLCSGRLVERKGVAWFIRAVMPAVTAEQPNTLLLVSGDGPERQHIQQAITETGQEDAVWLLGRTDDVLLKNLYNAVDCFVMPNIPIAGDMEGFGRVLIEAALCELPVVASGIEGIVDAVHHGKNGTVVPAKDATAFVKAILKIIESETTVRQARQVAKKARKYSQQTFGWKHIGAQYLAVYDEVAQKKQTPAEGLAKGRGV